MWYKKTPGREFFLLYSKWNFDDGLSDDADDEYTCSRTAACYVYFGAVCYELYTCVVNHYVCLRCYDVQHKWQYSYKSCCCSLSVKVQLNIFVSSYIEYIRSCMIVDIEVIESEEMFYFF